MDSTGAWLCQSMVALFCGFASVAGVSVLGEEAWAQVFLNYVVSPPMESVACKQVMKTNKHSITTNLQTRFKAIAESNEESTVILWIVGVGEAEPRFFPLFPADTLVLHICKWGPLQQLCPRFLELATWVRCSGNLPPQDTESKVMSPISLLFVIWGPSAGSNTTIMKSYWIGCFSSRRSHIWGIQ